MNSTAFLRITDALQANGKRVVDRGGGKASAQCPAHDDHTPSLSVGPRRDGKGVTVHCHAGCDHRDVLAAVGLADRDLFDDPTLRAAYNGHRVYDYPDGRTVHRGAGKRFRQSGNTKGRALFHADKIGVAALVFVPEGEKDVLAIEAAGGTAVCSAMGAGKAHLFDWSPLRGLDVVIVADDDVPGHAHAAETAAILAPLALSVRVVTAKSGKDAADHIAAGYTLTEFIDQPLHDHRARVVARDEVIDAEVPRFSTVTLADVTPEKVSWLWPGRLPLGKLITLDGDPGVGKSTLALTWAAIVTTGGVWPDKTRCEHPGDVILMSAEDGLADTIRPRLDAAGADATRIHAVQGVPLDSEGEALRMATLADVEMLRHLIKATGARLVIIDVLMAYMPDSRDSHRDQDVRRVLARLAALAESTGCAIVLLRHLNKGKGDPLYRGGGSIGIVGAARVGLLVAPDPDDEHLRVLASLKNNLAATLPSLTYRLAPADLYDVARVEWVGVSEHDARALLADHHDNDGGAEAEAEAWLEDYLTQQGSSPSKDAKADAWKNARIAERSLKRAANNLKVIYESKGFPRSTWWTLPSTVGPSPSGPTGSGPTGADDADQQEHPEWGCENPQSGQVQGIRPDWPENNGFQPPTGPGRCPECGCHTPTQGHRDTCTANTKGETA